MYKLYSRPGSGGFVVEAALVMSGAPFRVVDVAKDAVDDAFRSISPLGQVPVLELPDGSIMTESAAISMLIAEIYPRANLAPEVGSPGRPDYLRWMFFMSSVIYPAVLRWYYAARYTADATGVEAVKAAALAEIDQAFVIVDRALDGRGWIAGDHLSIADVYLVMLAHWHPVADCPRAEWTNVVRHAAALKALPVIAQLNAGHRMW